MKHLRALVVFTLLLFATQILLAAATDATLLLAADSAQPGTTVLAGIHLEMSGHWHTYWRNPGDSGIPTSIKWQLPAGVTTDEIQWPVPQKFSVEDLTTYIYGNEVVLFVPLHIAANVPAGPLEIKGKVKWLECDTQCIPGSADVQATLTIGKDFKPSSNAALFATWQKQLPIANGNIIPNASWKNGGSETNRILQIGWTNASPVTEADFFPYANDNFSVGFSNALSTNAGFYQLDKSFKKFSGDWPAEISGILLLKLGSDVQAFEIKTKIGGAQPALVSAMPSNAANRTSNSALGQETEKSLLMNLLYAFLGGIILNIMPCVLPVIALKILGFVQQGGQSPARVRNLGLIYAVGVLASFLLLAGIVISVKAAGHQAGWGLIFSSPKFIVIMTVVITLVALNLFGVFEITPGGKVMDVAGKFSAKEGASGAFFNGVLATLLATPCTAPFLAPAVGFALKESYGVIILFFLMIGIGLSLPYVILSWNPRLLKLLPKPGAWMEKFKIAMGFPMLATAFWLFELTVTYYGKRVLWLGFFLVVVALATWIYGEFVQRGRSKKGLAIILVIALLAGGYFYMVEENLRWRSPIMDQGTTVTQHNADEIDWHPWSTNAVMDARLAGHPVLVDFTADWCSLCQANRRSSIEIERVREKLKMIGAVALEGDYTRLPENMTIEMQRYGRASVPLVLVFPANLSLPAELLPSGYLTPSIVLNALDRAATAKAVNAAN